MPTSTELYEQKYQEEMNGGWFIVNVGVCSGSAEGLRFLNTLGSRLYACVS